MKLTVVEVDPGVKGDTVQGILVMSHLSYYFPRKVSINLFVHRTRKACRIGLK